LVEEFVLLELEVDSFESDNILPFEVMLMSMNEFFVGVDIDDKEPADEVVPVLINKDECLVISAF
jgi:hypothetical protein